MQTAATYLGAACLVQIIQTSKLKLCFLVHIILDGFTAVLTENKWGNTESWLAVEDHVNVKLILIGGW